MTETIEPSRQGAAGRRGLLAGFLALALAALLFPALRAQAGDHAAKALDLELVDVNPDSPHHGETLRLSDLYAERGVVVNFMASWCTPCLMELPDLQEIHASGVARVVCIAADEYGGPEALEPMIKAVKLTVPVLFAPEQQASRLAEHYTYAFLPATYLIDRTGRIQGTYQGVQVKDELIAEIEKHLR